MKSRFRLFRRGQVFYAHDNDTGQQTSLRTKDEGEAQALLHSKNEAHRQPVLNLQIARTYLTASDPEIAKRGSATGANSSEGWAEHQMILAHESNPEKRAYFECCWHLGGAQTDIASLTAENIDWQSRIVSFHRRKTGTPSIVRYSIACRPGRLAPSPSG